MELMTEIEGKCQKDCINFINETDYLDYPCNACLRSPYWQQEQSDMYESIKTIKEILN